MTTDERVAFAALALVDWRPRWDGEKPIELFTWFAGEAEGGLAGFYNEEDRDNFRLGQDGPFLRCVTGSTFRQMPFRNMRCDRARITSKESSK
jgi:hypothetical protein